MNQIIYKDTFKWIKSMSKHEICVMILNTNFDNLKTIDSKIKALKNWNKPNNNITRLDVKNIRKWIQQQLVFKKTRNKIVSMYEIFGKDKTCAMFGCSAEYLKKWLSAKTFNNIEYIYGENEIDIRKSTELISNSMQSIINDSTLKLIDTLIHI
tara:strand:- start:93 stop:554 length:462 start_codon:yes stop_codon:yes gene_type:complete